MSSSSGSDSGGGGRTDAQSQYGGGSYDSSQNQSGRGQSFGGGNGGNNNYQDRIQRISTGVEPGYTPTSDRPFGNTPEEAYRQGQITKDQYETTIARTTEVPKQENFLENVIDLYQQYSPLNLALNLGGSLLDGLGNVSKSIQNKAISFDLQNRLEKAYQDPTFDPFTPDASVTQLEQDLKSAQAGEFSQQQYQDRYAPQMNNMGEDRGGDGERQLVNALTPFAPYAITNTTPQQSMVNDYFANLGMGQQPLSSSLQTSYNNAKNNVSSILGTNQQFGYSTAPYGLLSSTNLADNPFNIEYLQQRGLI